MSAEFYRSWRMLWMQIWMACLQLNSEVIDIFNFYIREEVPNVEQ